jgi:hypothetical protein
MTIINNLPTLTLNSLDLKTGHYRDKLFIQNTLMANANVPPQGDNAR